jgi:hypothetical protein
MQNFLNRLCPLIDPVLEFQEGRTRARFREEVRIRKFVLVSTSGWWEIGNFGTVVRIVEEIAKTSSVEFAGAVLRPHAWLMKVNGELTQEGEAVLIAAYSAGQELITEKGMTRETLDKVSRPLLSQEDLWRRYKKVSRAA